MSLSLLAFLVSIGTVAGLLRLGTNAKEGDDGLTLDVSSEDLTIEVGSEPVFAVLPVELTVEEATQAGYTLAAFADSTDLVSTTDSSKTIPMVAVEEGALAPLTDNTYGLSLAKPESKDSEVYTTLSTDADNPTFITDKDYEPTEEGDTTTIYYGFYITPDVPYGTYTGTNINYTVEPHYITNLSFDGNGSDGGVDMEGITIIAGDTITLPKNTYTKEGYHFTGWNTEADGEDKAYADEAEFTAAEGVTEDVTLYAQWEALPVIGDLTEMQDFAKLSAEEKASVLASMAEGEQYTLKDNRDQKDYYISRLADGNIWMTQNLDLDLSTGTTLTPANTHISSNWIPANSTIAFTGTNVTGWQNNDNVPYSADPGELYVYSSGTTDNDDQYTLLADCKAAHPDCSKKNHVGNYYNWSAAVANNDTSGITTDYTNVDTDICPAGWELPTGRQNDNDPLEDNELGTLVNSYGILGTANSCGGTCVYYNYADGGFNAIRTAPLWLARSGSVYYGSLNDDGHYGGYWSSTVHSDSHAFNLSFDSGYVNPAVYNGRYNGYSVRCIAQ